MRQIRIALAAAGFLLLAGCQKSDTKILIGATTIPAEGAQPIEGSVIVITGKSIRAVGLQKDVPIPQASERVNLAGKWIVPKGAGRLESGQPANLVVLNSRPGTSAYIVERELVEGQWQTSR
jgi:imidazolonepropionase-like amidohydrolase